MEAVAHTTKPKIDPMSKDDLLEFFQNYSNRTLLKQFINYHLGNPHVWKEIKKAVELAVYFDQKVGMKRIYEDFRYSDSFTQHHGRFKAPNGFTSLYGALFDEVEFPYFNGPLRKKLGLV